MKIIPNVRVVKESDHGQKNGSIDIALEIQNLSNVSKMEGIILSATVGEVFPIIGLVFGGGHAGHVHVDVTQDSTSGHADGIVTLTLSVSGLSNVTIERQAALTAVIHFFIPMLANIISHVFEHSPTSITALSNVIPIKGGKNG